MKRPNLPLAIRRTVFERDQWRCKKCGHHAPTGENLDVHHIVDVADGGDDELENLDTLCGLCHAEWSWLWPAPREFSYAMWLDIPPAASIVRILLLGRAGLAIGVSKRSIERLLKVRR